MWWSVEVFKGPLDVALGDMVRGYYGDAKLTVQLFILKIAPGYDHGNKTENLRIVISLFFLHLQNRKALCKTCGMDLVACRWVGLYSS